ncbi:secreted frizzled-related protein 5 isoform X1 [Megalobrama amblycephala]|uniref:secreted frizzled-related protein 5 isoform X1 n=1 Tax=Megalobrama amblycephala TaxID=75352 RepID=UPI00201440C6|nr:secreted frizzled-related protein 5 isoform X1 [Megalobrama amblycephala]
MMLTAPALLLLLLGLGINAMPNGHWELQGSSRCVPIPTNMALCQGLGYNSMRMPNLLGHESPAEAVQQSTSWLPLLARECHPHARIFLCSLFAPVCLERIISPCRSLCVSVRDSCAPIMNCYGYPWPRILQCDQFPKDHLMCISSVAHMQNGTSNEGRGKQRSFPYHILSQSRADKNNAGFSPSNRFLWFVSVMPRASCTDCELEEATSSKELLDLFCKSDFVVKVRLSKLNSSSSVLTMFSLGSRVEVLKHGPLLGGEMRSRLTLWLERDVTCVGNLTRNHPDGGTFLLTGTVTGKRLLVTKAFSWEKRQRHLNQAARKWKSHRCRG